MLRRNTVGVEVGSRRHVPAGGSARIALQTVAATAPAPRGADSFFREVSWFHAKHQANCRILR